MTNVLAILILSSGFSVAVEAEGGFVERTFPNTAQGVEQFLYFSEPLIVKEGKNVKVCTITLAEDSGPVMQWLLENNMGPALLSRAVYLQYVRSTGAALESPASAAKACLATFPFIRKAQ
jgi:hypothetical protein